MNLQDLIKLAGVSKSPYDTPVQEQLPSDSDGMRTLIALVTPEQLNQLQGEAPVEEEGFANSGDEYAGEPEEYKGTLGSPADLSLRRYLGANGQPVKMENVYADHKVQDITEAWKQYKIVEHHQKDAEGNTIPHDDEVAEQKVAEEPNEANKFIKAKIDAEEDGDDSFTVDGKKYKVKDSADLDRLRALAGAQQVDEAPFPGEYDYSDDKYDDGGAVTGVAGKQDVDLRFAKWSEDTPSELMAVINKHNITPDEAWQMGARDNMADVDIVVDYHDKFTDRFDTSGMSDDEETEAIDIDGGTAWMDSPEHDALYRDIINPLCKAMGMEGGNVEECGQALMKYIDDTPPQESADISDLRTLAGI
tara:strand:+ start:363 stop:1448 length:1086 start_codon:yes stop_codon:yes gene_type:complete